MDKVNQHAMKQAWAPISTKNALFQVLTLVTHVFMTRPFPSGTYLHVDIHPQSPQSFL
jgi:hypothetical protein